MSRGTANDCTSQSVWMHVFAGFFLLLMLVTTSLQVTHVHQPALTAASHPAQIEDVSQGSGDSDLTCPFCAGLHHVLHLRSSAATIALLRPCTPVPNATCRPHSVDWHFALFTRPPPPNLL